jgi:2-iminobutanoate/2-iminopropanoate deaminase
VRPFFLDLTIEAQKTQSFFLAIFLALFATLRLKQIYLSPMKHIIQTDLAPLPIGPYSQAVKANGMLYTSGQIAINPATQEYTPLDVEAETELVMQNMKAVLEAAGTDFSAVVKTSIFLADMNDFPKVNAVYAKYFTGEFPARETVQVACLPKSCKVEISMIAVCS